MVETGVLLGVDVGTTNLKALAMTPDGEVLSLAEEPLPPPRVSGREVEFDPEEWWRALVRAVRRLGDLRERVEALCVGGQGPSLVLVDEEGRPLRPSIIWMDRRAVEEAEELSRVIGAKVDSYVLAAKLLWVARREPRVMERTYKFLTAYCFVSFRLTGRPTTGLIQEGYYPWWSTPYWSPDLLEAVGIPLEKAPEPLPVGEVIGEVTEEASRETGLPEGALVVQGLTDFWHDIIGAGVVRRGRALDHGGTSQGFDLCWDSGVRDPEGRVMTTRHVVRGYWNLSGIMSTTGALLRWLRDEFYREEAERARASGLDPYDLMAEEASKIPPGSDGLVILPYFAGERSPVWDPMARGVAFGLTLSHGRAHFVRAVMEATAYGLNQIKELIEGLGARVEEVRCVGGQSRSDLWCQIKADVLGVPVKRVAVEATEPLGEAITAGVGAGHFPSLEDGSDRVVRVTDTFHPDEERSGAYRPYYEVYKRLYPALRELFRAEAYTRKS
mgnify:CR=1 FL=1